MDGPNRATVSHAPSCSPKQDKKLVSSLSSAHRAPLKSRGPKWPWRACFCAASALLLLALHARWHIVRRQWRELRMPTDASSSSSSFLLPSTRAGRNPTHVEQACSDLIIPTSTSCPKYLTVNYLASAGIGHQFTELLFGLYAGHTLGLSFTWAPIVSSTDHGEDYSRLINRLGLEDLFVTALGARRASTLPRGQVDNKNPFEKQETMTWVHTGWDKDKRTIQLPCNSVLALDAWFHCHGVPKNNCFWAPEHEFLFQRHATCLRAGVRKHGDVFGRCLLVKSERPARNDKHAVSPEPLTPKTVVVAWHIRLGDVDPHKLADPFYERVIKTLKTISQGYRLEILLIGGGKGRSISRQQVAWLRNITSASGLTGTSVERFWLDDFESQFVAMMQADVLIGSGSSVPQVAALLSGRPLFFNHEPKHGYGHGMEATWDTVDMKSDGRVLDSLRRVRLALFAKMEQPERGVYNPCRPPLNARMK